MLHIKLVYNSAQAKEEISMKYERINTNTHHIKQLLVETLSFYFTFFI